MKKTLAAAAVVVVALLIAWSGPLFNPDATVKFDSLDQHYAHLSFIDEQLTIGEIPFWNHNLYSGYPLVAEQQTGLFYMPNWLLFLVGVSPKSMIWLMFGHALLAGLGMFALIWYLTGRRAPAVLAGVAFPLMGWFIGHTSHFGMHQTASWLPLLALAAIALARGRSNRMLWLLVLGTGSGLMILAGHSQTALFVLLTVLALGIASASKQKDVWGRVRSAARVIGVLGLGVASASVQLLASAQLISLSNRADITGIERLKGIFDPAVWPSLLIADAYGAVSQVPYIGPNDVTQYYIFIGTALSVLAFIGMRSRYRYRWLLLATSGVAVLYGLGPLTPVNAWISGLPIFSQLRHANHVLIIPTFAIVVLAAYGLSALIEKRVALWWQATAWTITAGALGASWLLHPQIRTLVDTNSELVSNIKWSAFYSGLALLALGVLLVILHMPKRKVTIGLIVALVVMEIGGTAVIDNKGFFGSRSAFSSELPVEPTLAPGERLWEQVPHGNNLWSRTEISSTWGYDPIVLRDYSQLHSLLETNPNAARLLNVAAVQDPEQIGTYTTSPESPLGFAFFPKEVRAQEDLEFSSHDFSQATISKETVKVGEGFVSSVQLGANAIDLELQVDKPGLLAISLPFYPGWRAYSDGREVPLVKTNLALSGAIVDRSVERLQIRFIPTIYLYGTMISLLALLILCIWALKASLFDSGLALTVDAERR